MTFQRTLERWDACLSAVEWVGDRTPAEAWRDCERPDWQAWLLCYAVPMQRAAPIMARALWRALDGATDLHPATAAWLDVAEAGLRGDVTRERLWRARDEIAHALLHEEWNTDALSCVLDLIAAPLHRHNRLHCALYAHSAARHAAEVCPGIVCAYLRDAISGDEIQEIVAEQAASL